MHEESLLHERTLLHGNSFARASLLHGGSFLHEESLLHEGSFLHESKKLGVLVIEKNQIKVIKKNNLCKSNPPCKSALSYLSDARAKELPCKIVHYCKKDPACKSDAVLKWRSCKSDAKQKWHPSSRDILLFFSTIKPVINFRYKKKYPKKA